MSGQKNVRFMDDGAAHTGELVWSNLCDILKLFLTDLFAGSGWTPPKRNSQSNSGTYFFIVSLPLTSPGQQVIVAVESNTLTT